MAGARTPLDSIDAKSRTFRPVRWLRWAMGVAAPAFAAAFAWLAYDIAQQRVAGRGWESAWPVALVVAALCGLALLFLAGLAHALRARLAVGEEGITVRGIFRTRAFPWKQLDGYRWIKGQMNVYAAGSELPVEISFFEDRDTLHAIFRARLRDLDAEVTEREAREIRDDLSLGLTQAEKEANLAPMRRLSRVLNWTAYATTVVGGGIAMFQGPEALQIAAASVLVGLPLVLLGLALANPNRLRLDYREGSIYPEGASGIMASGVGLVAMAAFDPHTLLGERFFFWAAGLTAFFTLAWLYVERERMAEHMHSIVGALNVLGFACFSALWGGGSAYLVNRHADLSAPSWAATKVLGLREKGRRAARSYLVKVAPWSASPEAIELALPRGAYRALAEGMEAEVGVREGALGIAWVETVRPAKKQ